MSLLDNKHYTDINTGKKISLRNASILGVNSYFDDNSISVYDKTTNTHHRVSEPFDTEDDALDFMDEFNAQIRGEVVHDTYNKPSQREIEARRVRNDRS